MPFPRLWTLVRLSAEMLIRPPDLLFVPAHVLPPVHPHWSVVTVHDLGYKYFPQAHRPLDRLYLDLSTRWNALAASRVIADSAATRDDLVRFYGVNPAKVTVVYPALAGEFQQFRPEPARVESIKQKYGIDGEYLLSVGTLHPRKNYVRLLQAFARLGKPLQLVIAGKRGWLYNEILGTVKTLGLESRVHLLDYVASADLPSLYAGARTFVFPSLYEGFGFPVLEAQACGVPVVCSRSSSLPEVAGEGAEFFDPLDTEEMAAVIGRLLDQPVRREALVERGCANLTRFGWEHAASQVLGLFSELLDSR